MTSSLLAFPKFFAGYLLGFVQVILTDIDILTLFIISVLVGGITNPIIGVIVFLSTWQLRRALDSSALSALVQTLRYHADALYNGIVQHGDATYRGLQPAPPGVSETPFEPFETEPLTKVEEETGHVKGDD